MNKLQVLLLNAQAVEFHNEKTGEVRPMTKITYGVDCSETDRFKGYSILECYTSEKAFGISQKYFGKVVPAEISLRPLTNGMKYVLTSINGEQF